MSTNTKTAEQILRDNIPTITFDKLIGTPVTDVVKAMEAYAAQTAPVEGQSEWSERYSCLVETDQYKLWGHILKLWEDYKDTRHDFILDMKDKFTLVQNHADDGLTLSVVNEIKWVNFTESNMPEPNTLVWIERIDGRVYLGHRCNKPYTIDKDLSKYSYWHGAPRNELSVEATHFKLETGFTHCFADATVLRWRYFSWLERITLPLGTVGEAVDKVPKETAINLIEGALPYIKDHLTDRQIYTLCTWIDSYLDKVFKQIKSSL